VGESTPPIRPSEEALKILAREIVREAQLHRGEGSSELHELERQHNESIGRLAQYLESMRGLWSLQFDIAKQTSATSGVLLLGLGALVGVFYLDDLRLPLLAVVSAVLLVVCAICSIVQMFLVRNILLHQISADVRAVESYSRLGEDSESEEDEQAQKLARSERRSMRWFEPVNWASALTLVGGAVCLLVFALYNLTGGIWP
jgi:hypothetical protein